MSRAAVLDHLKADDLLKDLGVQVHASFDDDEPPSRTQPFVILRWGEKTSRGIGRRAPRILTVWAHYPTSQSTSYGDIDAILNRLEELLLEMTDVPGGDGDTVTSVRYTGSSGDLRDTGYDTICRNAAFEVLYRTT